MYKIGDKIKVINAEGFVRDKNWNLVPVAYDGFVTDVTLVEDDVVWIIGTHGGHVWIDAHRIEAIC
jgi:hypothetical protein